MKSKLLFLFIILSSVSQLSYSQTRQVSGKISDLSGKAVSGASVIIKGSSTGSAADENGQFSIIVSGPNDILIISSVGYKSQEVNVGNRNNINITLESTSNLEGVTVTTALGIKRSKRSLGYSAQEVSGDNLVQSRQTNVVNALRGQVAGVQINSGGGAPGQGSRIVIRGIKSLSTDKSNQPLFVIDGIVMDNSTTTVNDAGSLRGLSNRAADINPDDIENIAVLRGGAATALYGQAGSDGVIIITTKSAKAGKMKIGFSTTYGIDEVNKFPEVQNKYTQGTMGNYDPANFTPAWGPSIEKAKMIDPTHPDELFHNYARGYQPGNQFRSSLNLSGGTENALLTSSFSYFKQNGVIPNSDYKNISARLAGQLKVNSLLKISPSIYFINSGGYRVNADRFNEQLSYWSPRWDVQDYINPNGTMKSYGNDNPIFVTSTNRFKDNVNRLIGNVAITLSPEKWFDLDYRIGMDYYADFRRHTAPGPKGFANEILLDSDNGPGGLGFVNEYRISNRILNSNIIATFKKDWSSKFNTVLRLGNDVRATTYSELTSTGSELDVPDLLSLNNAKVRSNRQFESEYRIVSAFGDLTLGYDNFLFLNVTGRNDWSSTLVAPNNSFFYPSASLSYVFTDHLKKPYWFSFGKLRASLAEIGKDTDPYKTNTYYNSSIITSSNQVIWTRGDIKGIESLKPERTRTFELGTELRFLQNRVGLDFTWYKLNSRDQIIEVKASPASGFTGYILNAGEIENKGFEILLNATPIRTNDFSWDATINFSRNRNKVVKIIEGLTEIPVGSQFQYPNLTVDVKYVPGYAVGNIYGTSYLRYYGTNVDDKTTLYKDLPLVIANSGDFTGFPIRDGTKRILGNSQPDWTGGITNSFSYKNFRLSFLFETQQGQERYNQLGNFMASLGVAKYTEDRNTTKIFEGVLPNGEVNTQQVWLGQGVGPDNRNYTAGFYRNIYRGVAENFVEDASWVRLRNLSLSYKVPVKVFKNNVIKDVTVSFTGNNLFLWTKYSGFDPETSSSSANSNADGFTGFSYPAVRSYLFSINVNF